MAVTVKTLFKNGTFLYKMSLLADKSGLASSIRKMRPVHTRPFTTTEQYQHPQFMCIVYFVGAHGMRPMSR